MQHAEQCQITTRLTTGHFTQATTVKRKPGTENSHGFTSRATFCVSVIRLIHTKTSLFLFPEKNKQSTLTNRFWPTECEPYKALTAPVERGHIQSEITHTSSSTALHLGSCWDSGSKIILCCLGSRPQTLVSNQQRPPVAKINVTGGCHSFTGLGCPTLPHRCC